MNITKHIPDKSLSIYAWRKYFQNFICRVKAKVEYRKHIGRSRRIIIREDTEETESNELVCRPNYKLEEKHANYYRDTDTRKEQNEFTAKLVRNIMAKHTVGFLRRRALTITPEGRMFHKTFDNNGKEIHSIETPPSIVKALKAAKKCILTTDSENGLLPAIPKKEPEERYLAAAASVVHEDDPITKYFENERKKKYEVERRQLRLHKNLGYVNPCFASKYLAYEDKPIPESVFLEVSRRKTVKPKPERAEPVPITDLGSETDGSDDVARPLYNKRNLDGVEANDEDEADNFEPSMGNDLDVNDLTVLRHSHRCNSECFKRIYGSEAYSNNYTTKIKHDVAVQTDEQWIDNLDDLQLPECVHRRHRPNYFSIRKDMIKKRRAAAAAAVIRIQRRQELLEQQRAELCDVADLVCFLKFLGRSFSMIFNLHPFATIMLIILLMMLRKFLICYNYTERNILLRIINFLLRRQPATISERVQDCLGLR